MGIVTIGVVAMGVRTTTLLAGFCRHNSRFSGLHQIIKFQRFNARRVEHLGLILQMDVLGSLIEFCNLLHTFFQELISPEDPAVRLHRLTNIVGNVLDILART